MSKSICLADCLKYSEKEPPVSKLLRSILEVLKTLDVTVKFLPSQKLNVPGRWGCGALTLEMSLRLPVYKALESCDGLLAIIENYPTPQRRTVELECALELKKEIFLFNKGHISLSQRPYPTSTSVLFYNHNTVEPQPLTYFTKLEELVEPNSRLHQWARE